MCDMRTRKDPTRICTKALSADKLRARVLELADLKLPSDFQFGLEALHRGCKPPVVIFYLRPDASTESLPYMLTLIVLLQHFLGSDVMEDGQIAGQFHPDRSEEDREDLELFAPIDSEPEA